MKILAFSDLHRDAEAAHRVVAASELADVVVGAGDFGRRGEGPLETLNILMNCAVPVIYVHGNHDNPQELACLCDGWSKGHYLHGNEVSLGGVTFFGLGGEIPSRSDEPWNMAETEATAASMLQKCPAGAILVTHTPPFGYADVQKNREHEGSTAIAAAIRSTQPVLSLCGHIHHSWGSSELLGDTRIYNLGPGLTWFKV